MGKYTPAFLIHESYSLIDRRQKTNATIKTAKNHLDMPYNKQIKDNVILDSGDLQWRSLPQIAPKYIIYIYTLPFFQKHTVSPDHSNKILKVDQQEKSLSYIRTQASKPTS